MRQLTLFLSNGKHVTKLLVLVSRVFLLKSFINHFSLLDQQGKNGVCLGQGVALKHGEVFAKLVHLLSRLLIDLLFHWGSSCLLFRRRLESVQGGVRASVRHTLEVGQLSLNQVETRVSRDVTRKDQVGAASVHTKFDRVGKEKQVVCLLQRFYCRVAYLDLRAVADEAPLVEWRVEVQVFVGDVHHSLQQNLALCSAGEVRDHTLSRVHHLELLRDEASSRRCGSVGFGVCFGALIILAGRIYHEFIFKSLDLGLLVLKDVLGHLREHQIMWVDILHVSIFTWERLRSKLGLDNFLVGRASFLTLVVIVLFKKRRVHRSAEGNVNISNQRFSN
jgi:hypothetical protein